jgi:hypothetical protein
LRTNQHLETLCWRRREAGKHQEKLNVLYREK